jgi:hypothetical protein
LIPVIFLFRKFEDEQVGNIIFLHSHFVNNNVVTGLSSAFSRDKQPLAYPNPATDVLHLENPSDEIVEAKIVDPAGIVVWKNFLMPNNSETFSMRSFKRGFYFLIVEGEDRRFCKKIIIN